MARDLKNILARYTEKRSFTRRNQSGRFLSSDEKRINPLKTVRPDLAGQRALPAGKNGEQIRTYTWGANTGKFSANDQPSKPEFQNDVFASETDYDRSVASVIARIKSGEVQPIEPDED